ncbi:MAG: chemotaxis-specific protein-glutamate methyltransferase CheB [Rhizorhabdus sp.]|jgi:two-component system chemotaxis response regulator CheB|uniref:chemotaxis-specific protein-glutamate methyltransferase CheB n=1 Tax=Rhizorhabdus sp. TaxID=1968843 RepID=UPI001B6C3150|nr:chemotaxis-specific protein-glutamate methyltransferase CheB [Rhizorhabdus sp.]MBP8233194.1 chemotaxis-specific protein-glutamate methyltransferase CheB [Rhizorhabdus sp.]
MMETARVLIVDDSLTMRALFSGVLERARGIEVVGMAANADEARELMIRLKPSVITLDVEMPGMSGIEFLEEIMRERPTPVVMLSTLTQKGAEISFKALELGAVDCFPKPKSATPEEFNALAPKLAALVIAASSGGVKKAKPTTKPAAHDAFDWNGKMVAMSTSTGGVDALINLLPTFPANCPPTVICLPIDPGFIDPLVKRLKAACPAQIVLAEDGQPLKQGHIYLATDLGSHAVIDRWPDPSLRLLRSDPVGGSRPSASLLFATVAKTAGANAVGCILTGLGTDGAAGLKALRAAGGYTIAEDASTCVVDQAPSAARAAGAVDVSLPLGDIAAAILNSCRLVRDAA